MAATHSPTPQPPHTQARHSMTVDNTERKLRIAMLGCGRMGQKHALNVSHLAPLHTSPRCSVTNPSSPSRSPARRSSPSRTPRRHSPNGRPPTSPARLTTPPPTTSSRFRPTRSTPSSSRRSRARTRRSRLRRSRRAGMSCLRSLFRSRSRSPSPSWLPRRPGRMLRS